MKKSLLLFIALIFSGFICLAQENSDSTDESSSTESSSCWNENDEHDWSFNEFEFEGRPTIETPYGVANIGLKSIGKGFMKAGVAEIRLGFAKLKDRKDNIVKYNNMFLLLSNISTELNAKSTNQNNLNPEMWRFGIGNITGYGYSFGNSNIIPYTSSSFIWTRLNVKNFSTLSHDTTKLSPVEQKDIELFNGSFRFGTMTEGGLKIQLIPIITLNAGYERSVVFPRLLVWKFAGSMIIEGIASGAIDKFVNEIMDGSPAAGPIVNFVLKNALSYGMYQLRHEKMNWPFNSVEPLYTDSWKVGITFTF